jgi:hypothetical protein
MAFKDEAPYGSVQFCTDSYNKPNGHPCRATSRREDSGCGGYRLIATRGWSLYVVDEVDDLMYVYDAEQWGEWIRRIDTNLDELFVYSDRYYPSPLFAYGMHLTLEAFLSKFE